MTPMEKEAERAIEMGRKNATIMPRLKAWCKHLDIKITASGLLAQAYNLPIGMLRVECPHASDISESGNLGWIASEFVRNNCINCPHHDELAADNYGRDVIANDAQRAREAEERAESDRETLRISYEESKTALETNDITEQSVNALILAIQDHEQDQGSITGRLISAARIGPELFSENAMQVMVQGFQREYGGVYIEAVRIVCDSEGTLPEYVLEAAVDAIRQKNNVDASCKLVANFYKSEFIGLLQPIISNIIEAMDYNPLYHIGRVEKLPLRCPGSFELTKRLFEEAKNNVRDIIDARFRSSEEMDRYYAANLLSELLPDMAEIVMEYAPAIIRSLGLEDREMNQYAHGSAASLLSDLYVVYPSQVESAIGQFWTFASEDIRIRLLKIYERIGRDSYSRWETQFPQELYVQQLPVVIDKLYEAVGDVRYTYEQRMDVCSDLLDIVKHNPAQAADKLERMIGRLRMTIKERESISTDQKDPDKIWEASGWKDCCYGMIWRLANMIRSIAEVDLEGSYNTIVKAINSLPKDDEQTKYHLVGILDCFCAKYELVPQLIPEVYKHLTNFESIIVRSAAIKVVGELLSKIPEQVPDDMVELLIEAYLGDSKVAIHQATIRALAHYNFERNERGFNAINIIARWEVTYRNSPRETTFLRDIVRTMRWAFKDLPEVEEYLQRTVLIEHAFHSDEHFAEDALSSLSKTIISYPDNAERYVEAVLSYLLRTHRDIYNGDSRRDGLISSLLAVGSDALCAHWPLLVRLVNEKTSHEPFDVFDVLEVISSHSMREETVKLSQQAYDLLADVKANRYWRTMFRAMVMAEEAEMVVENDTDEAVKHLDAASKLLQDVE